MTDVDTSVWIRDLSEKLDKARAESADLRRLVEEAQQRSAAYDRDRQEFAAERDRLRAESAARETTIQTLGCDLVKSAAEMDQLKTELTALENIVDEERQRRKSACAANAQCTAEIVRLQGELERATVQQPLNTERLISATPIKTAEQAQGEGAHYCSATERYEVQVAALAKRIDALDNALARALEVLDHDTIAHVHCRACGKVLMADNLRVADGCPCNSGRGVNHGIVPKDSCTCKLCDPAQTGSTRKPAPPSPSPEVARPVHVFVCGTSGSVHCAVVDCRCFVCSVPRSIHAVPPIPEGK